jgi:hypothetical protein
MFTEQDLQFIRARGSDPAIVREQLENFERGFPFLSLDRPATVGDGILRMSEAEAEAYQAAYEAELPALKVLKFVPASGAASRMFQALFAMMGSYQGTESEQAALDQETGLQTLGYLFRNIRRFAFAEDLEAALGGRSLEERVADREYLPILKALLGEEGLGYGQLPKGLLKFHRYAEGARTPLEEHIVEGAAYGAAPGGIVRLHFTVSPEHRAKFEALVEAVRARYEAALNIRLEISFSEQKPGTDTIAADGANQPFRNPDGSLLFRPAGHGALLENLADLSADLVFVKNIDNVAPDRIKGETFRWKKILAGVLLEARAQMFALLPRLRAGEEAAFREAEQFLRERLCVEPPAGYEGWGLAQRQSYLVRKLDRPIRVCGMVKNEGEPGGGPFWALNSDGTRSLQIAEGAQVDKQNPQQQAIAQAATHFNPVDLVCAWTREDGSAFDLLAHRDPLTGFISSKSKDGKELKAQELPGLWNGSMSDWNTLFVEVPIITFNPVKTVNDLLRPEHQA